ncbi:MAG: hypothetical protein FJY88_03305 [Candidatus Eisenbacteria bacterium]|nr:hypothetical protein [Candidatus Eisenbacteria bacterium]
MRQLLLSIALALFASSTSFAETYVVLPDGTGDFPTIQAGLDAVVPGDVIELTAGTYTGDGNRDLDFLGKDVTVRSQTGDPATCVLDGGGSETDPHKVFHLRNGETGQALLEGIQITGGRSGEAP